MITVNLYVFFEKKKKNYVLKMTGYTDFNITKTKYQFDVNAIY